VDEKRRREHHTKKKKLELGERLNLKRDKRKRNRNQEKKLIEFQVGKIWKNSKEIPDFDCLSVR